jgi:hypothetical protein
MKKTLNSIFVKLKHIRIKVIYYCSFKTDMKIDMKQVPTHRSRVLIQVNFNFLFEKEIKTMLFD